jgi:NAD(P)-dependent dehydrogenase (short-subunit alcohol dehydrogenase family)
MMEGPDVHQGRVALVTGAARGIGLAIARVLAGDGARIAMLDVDPSVEDQAKAIAADHGTETVGVVADVSSGDSLESAFSVVAESLGAVSILVNNAAIATEFGLVRDLDLAAWQRQISVNLTGPFLATKLALDQMVPAGWGRVIMISSGAGEMGGVGQAGYVASKAGIVGLAKTVALEHARDGVTCNALLPGLIETDTASAIRADIRERIIRRIPIRRMGEPEEVAYAVSWLASDRAAYINGASLFVSAGQELFTF